MSQPRRGSAAGVAALVVTLAVLLAGCTDPAGDPAGEPDDPSTPLASYDTTAVSLERAPYCERVPEEATGEALGEAPRTSTAYDNGDPVRVAGGKDVAHEYGCTWSAGPTRARTWLFAPPVTGQRARDLVGRARTLEGCVPDDRAPAFGTPSVALVCTADRTVSVSYRGLFGDAWLVCELSGRGERAELAGRADRWCVQVVEAARGDAG